MKQTYFLDKWFDDPSFIEWLQKGDITEHFGCKFCKRKNLKLTNMGIMALRSHSTGKKHLEAKKAHTEIKNFFKKHVNTTISSSNEVDQNVPSTSAETIELSSKDIRSV